MATIIQENGKYRVQVRRKGHRVVSKSGFNSEKEAKDWAILIESELLHGIKLPEKVPVPVQPMLSLAEALKKYGKEITPAKKGASREQNRLKRLQTLEFAQKPIDQVTDDDLTDFVNSRRSERKAENTIRLDLMLFSAVYKTARQVWKIKIPNPVRDVAIPKNSKWRDRKLEAGEFEYLVKGFDVACPKTPHLPELLTLAIESGMREGELLAIEHHDVDFNNCTLRLTNTKSGDPRDVPLSVIALGVVKKLPKGKFFEITQDRLVRGFQEACEHGREIFEKEHNRPAPPRFLKNLRFHDLRHAAASKWAPVLTAPELAKMMGWKTLSLVMRYYSPNPSAIAKKLSQTQ